MKLSNYHLKNFNIQGFNEDYIFSTIKNTNNFYEIEILERWNKYLNKVENVLDVGSNIGNHSLYWSQKDNIKKIIAFEPVKTNFELLEKNIKNNNIHNVEAYQIGLGKKEGFAVIDNNDPNNLGATSLSFVEDQTDIKILPGDVFLSDKNYGVDLIKIDVEGFEIDVLEGFKKTIDEYKPILWIEINLDTLERILKILDNANYVVVDIAKFNVLAIHRTKAGLLKEISKQKLIYKMLKNLKASWMYRNHFLESKEQKNHYEHLFKEFKGLSEKFSSQFLFEQKKCEDLVERNRGLESDLLDAEARVEEFKGLSEKFSSQFLFEQKKCEDLVERNRGLESDLLDAEARVEEFKGLSEKFSSQFLFEQKKSEELTEISGKRLSQFLYEQKKAEKLKKQNDEFEKLIKAYKSRKIVKATDKLINMFNLLKSYLKIYDPEEDSITAIKEKELEIQKNQHLDHLPKNIKMNISSSEITEKKPKKLKDIKVAVILDEFSYNSFKDEFNAIPIEPSNWLEKFETENPDIFFCESAWSGIDSELRPWKGKIYSSVNFKSENRNTLLKILEYCKQNDITTIFWNKEDPTHYDDKIHNFVDTAIKFDHIFTTAEECVPRYKQEHGHKSVHSLMFGAQPKLFNPIETEERTNDVIFAGSWYNSHPQRCVEMKEIFDTILSSGCNLKIYDRAYYTHSDDENRIFPEKYHKFINPPVPFDQIDNVYKESKYALNINTVTNSATMFARRVFELMLCNTLVLSNYSKGMQNLFQDNVVFISKGGMDLSDSEQKRLNNLYNVLKNHTYSNRFKQILNSINYEYVSQENVVTFYYVINDQSKIHDVLKHYESIIYHSKKLILLLSTEIPNHQIKNLYQKYANNDVTIYSLNHILNQEHMIQNDSKYFIFANLQLDQDFVGKAILHFSYIGSELGITLGHNFTFKKSTNIQNALFNNNVFKDVFNNFFKNSSKEFLIYNIQISE